MKAKAPADITLASETARFHELASQSLEWVWETDAQGNLTYCSPSCKALYGYESVELLGRNAIEMLTPPEDREEQRKIIEEIRLSKKSSKGIRGRATRKTARLSPLKPTTCPCWQGKR